MDLDYKVAFALIATALSVAAYYPYMCDMFARKTKPHIYTWLIWCITQGIAVAGLWFGGGGWGAMNLSVSLVFVGIVCIFSIWYGTKNITLFDTLTFVMALCAVLVWVQLENPITAVFIATGIDMAGYIPTLRKSYDEPWSETVSAWMFFALANLLSLAALSTYSALTMTYLIALSGANILVVVLCLTRRRSVKQM